MCLARRLLPGRLSRLCQRWVARDRRRLHAGSRLQHAASLPFSLAAHTMRAPSCPPISACANAVPAEPGSSTGRTVAQPSLEHSAAPRVVVAVAPVGDPPACRKGYRRASGIRTFESWSRRVNRGLAWEGAGDEEGAADDPGRGSFAEPTRARPDLQPPIERASSY